MFFGLWSKMDVTAIILFLALCGIVRGNTNPINIHSCQFDQRSSLFCDWQGEGYYRADRPLVGVHKVEFKRFYASGSIDLMHNVPDLVVVIVTSGDARCETIIHPPRIKVYVRGNECGVSIQSAITLSSTALSLRK